MNTLTALGMLLLTAHVSIHDASWNWEQFSRDGHRSHQAIRHTERCVEAAQDGPIFCGDLAALHKKDHLQPETINTDTNSAATIAWMSTHDREVLYWLNVARMNPSGFYNRFLLKAAQANPSDSYLRSLMTTMYSMKPVPALLPDKTLYDEAMCHARSSGSSGYVGHARTHAPCKKIYSGECCSYGAESPLGVVIQLLVDDGVPSLGHRILCLEAGFKLAGIASAPHTRFGSNTVIDFR